MAQTKTVTGTILDEFGESVIGASVIEVGNPTNGSTTDVDGRFSVKVPENATLRASYIGYAAQDVPVAGKTNIVITLHEDQEQLDEVVVVGYGTMKKTDLTGSVSSLSTAKLTAKGAPSLLENMQGSVPGVSITQSGSRAGGDFNIEIRGKSSINSDVTPMYVVDGVICSDIQWLNPQDIERMDILKDASSTAIYGSRATAGVIMITTKSGSGVTKAANQKATVSYDGYYGISQVARMPDFMDGQEFYNYRFLKFLSYAEGGASSAQSGQPNYGMGASTFKQMALWNDDTNEGRMKALLAQGKTYDWPDMVTQNGSQQNHYLAVSGSTDKLGYHMGIGYNSEEGVYKGDEQQKINFKGSVDANISKYVTAGFSVNMAHINHDYANDDAIKYAYRMNAFMQPYDENGDLYEKPGNYVAMGSSSSNQFSDQRSSLYIMDNTKKNRETWRMLGNIYLQIKPMDGLTFKTTYSPNYTYYRQGTFTGTLDGAEQNEATKESNRNFSWTWDNVLTYDHTFHKDHSLNLMGLFSMTASNTEKDSFTAQGVLDGSKWWNIGSAGTNNITDLSNSYTESSMVSYALRANYSYLGRYMLTGTIRWDGSSRFDEDNRWGAFPSVAAAWRISEESWLKRDWLSNLKIRVSYGVTGNNAGIGDYATQQTVSGPNYYPFGSTTYNAYYPSSIVDKNLQWEMSKEVNFGIDFGFLNNRITGTADIYQKNSEDLLYAVTLPYEAGSDNDGKALTMTTNIGKVRNRGIEVSLTTVNVETKNWHWETSFNYARNLNSVRDINGTGEDLPANNLFIGHPINNVYGYQWTGIVSDRDMVVPDNEIAKAKGLEPGTTMRECDYYYATYGWTEGNVIIKDENGDGKFDESDKKIYSSDPSWTGSFTTTLTYKNWDLSASLYTKQNYTVNSAFYGEYLNFGDRGRQRLNVDYYIPAGTLIDCDGVRADGTYINPVYQETTHYGSYPFPNNAANNSGVGASNWLSATNSYVDASYVKVKNITLGYSFSKNVLKKCHLQKLRLYCTVTNPFVWSDYKGFDPEWANSALKNDGPSTITYQFGASVKF
jgi:TonB-linked SusC/RagA family outer membrane protein